MRRRELLGGLLGAAAILPLAQRAMAAMPSIGFVHPESPGSTATRMPSFHAGLAEAGYVDGRNVIIDYHWAYGDYFSIPGLVAKAVGKPVSLVVAIANDAAVAAKAATNTIPIVAFVGGDPIAQGLARSFAAPGGNLTGVDVFLEGSRGGKRLQLLHDVLPGLTSFGVLINPTQVQYPAFVAEVTEAAAQLEVELVQFAAATGDEVDTAFAAMKRQGLVAALVMIDPTFDDDLRERIVAAAKRHGIATQDAGRETVELGGLMSYTPDMPGGYRLTGLYAGRVLAGADPATMPIERLAKYELVINLKRARELGITMPDNLLATADVVLE